MLGHQGQLMFSDLYCLVTFDGQQVRWQEYFMVVGPYHCHHFLSLILNVYDLVQGSHVWVTYPHK